MTSTAVSDTPAQTRPSKRTKIVATIGPASESEAVLRAMIQAGLDVARINFSHGKPAKITEWVQRIRKVSEELAVPVAIMGDLQGPRIRVGEVENGQIELRAGDTIVLTPTILIGTPQRVSVTFPLAADVIEGCSVLLDDGNLDLTVERIYPQGDLTCRIKRGGTLSSRRGINLPGRRVSSPSVSEKDRADIDLALELHFDFLGLSFVQSADDVRQLNEYLRTKGRQIPVIAKIEKKSALDDIVRITQEAYGVMVARGDLALEMSIQDVPVAQKRIIKVCRAAAIPVITATQMLESMTSTHKPTRAEATDVANAILDGTDAVMLSGESAIGKFPVEAVTVMATIAARTERAWLDGELPSPPPLPGSTSLEGAVAAAGQSLAAALGAKVIVVHTTSGSTARRTACHRPPIPILTLTARLETARLLALTWGVQTAVVPEITGTAHLVRSSLRKATDYCGARPGDTIAILAGTPFQVSGRTNLIKIEKIPGD